jgi:hypothetical protein
MSVKRAQIEIDSAEFSEWIAYHKLKPFTFNNVENILSILAAMVGNALRKKGKRELKPIDFIPTPRKRPRDNPETMQRKLKSFFGFK